jgi:hypothetical protein
MKPKLLSLILLIEFITLNLHGLALEKNKEMTRWRVTTIEQVNLKKMSTEGIALLEHDNGKAKSHSISYVVNEKTVQNKILPADIYFDLKMSLQAITNKASIDTGQSCSGKVEFLSQRIAANGKSKTQVLQNYCLNESKSLVRENFRAWYRKAMASAGL